MAGINPAMLTLVREYRQLTQSELADRAGVTQGFISKSENGLIVPSEENVEKIAAALEWPAPFFYKSEQVYGFATACLYHRKQASLPVATLRVVQATANVLRIAATPLLREVAFDAPNEFPVLDIDAYEGSPGRIAQMVRSTWRMPLGPVSSVVATLESAGGIVYRLPFGTRQLDAVSHWPPHMPPLFLVNKDAPPDRARFSLAHELGHIVMHRVPNRNMEREADQFASEFLMPAREIRTDLRGLDLPQAAQLKAFWKVSMAALIMKARDTEAITPSRAKRLYAELSRLGHRISEPVEIPAEEPTLLDAVIDTHRREHRYGVAELVELAGIPEKDFRAHYLDAPPLRAVK